MFDRKKYIKNRRAEFASRGICGGCFKNQIKEGRTRCAECLQKKINNKRAKDYFSGFTQRMHENMIKMQKGKCLICGGIPIKLVIDHCHDRKVVRGLLCQNCNVGIGMFRNNPKFLMNAVEYLLAETYEDKLKIYHGK